MSDTEQHREPDFETDATTLSRVVAFVVTGLNVENFPIITKAVRDAGGRLGHFRFAERGEFLEIVPRPLKPKGEAGR